MGTMRSVRCSQRARVKIMRETATMRNAFKMTVVFGATIASLLSGCGKKDDSISQAEKKDKEKPSIAETKAIAE